MEYFVNFRELKNLNKCGDSHDTRRCEKMHILYYIGCIDAAELAEINRQFNELGFTGITYDGEKITQAMITCNPNIWEQICTNSKIEYDKIVYFGDCTTIDSLKNRYADLYEKYRDTAEQEKIDRAYNGLFALLKCVVTRRDGTAYYTFDSFGESPDEFTGIVKYLIDNGIKFKISGSWVWIDADRDLKNLGEYGAKYSSKYKNWIWYPKWYGKYRGMRI